MAEANYSLERDLASLGHGDRVRYESEGHPFEVSFHERQAYGDNNLPVEGDKTGEYTLYHPNGKSEDFHVGPMRGTQAKAYQAEQVARRMRDHWTKRKMDRLQGTASAHTAITLPEPMSSRGSYSSPGYYVIDQAGNPVSDRFDSQALAYANLHGGAGVQYLDQPEQGHLNQPWPPELHTVVGHTQQGGQMYTEADLLRAMASTSDLDEQRYLMGALEEVRRDARAVMAGAAQVDFAPPNHVGEMRPYYPYHSGAFGSSSATDWLADMGASDDGMTEHMLTMGSRFFIGCHPEVKADPVEYMTQALGVARVAASQFANIEGAVNIFMEHVANLARVDLSKMAQEELLPWEAPPEQLPPTESDYPGPYSKNQNTEVNPEAPGSGPLPGLDNGASARAVQGAAVLSSHQHMSEFLWDPPTPEELAEASGPGNLDQQFGQPATSQDDSAGAEAPNKEHRGVDPVVASRHQAADDDDGDDDGGYKYIKHRPGHKDSEGNEAPWVVVQKGTGDILSSHPSKDAAIDGFKAMMRGKHMGRAEQMTAYLEGTPATASRAFSPEPTTYEEYLARLAPGSAAVTQEFYSGAMAAHSPSADDRSVPEWGKRSPKASVTGRPAEFRGVTAANEDMLNPQAFERADESDAPAIREQTSGGYDPKATWAQSGEAAHDETGLIPQTDLSENFSNISDFPETGDAAVPSTRAPFVGGQRTAIVDLGGTHPRFEDLTPAEQTIHLIRKHGVDPGRVGSWPKEDIHDDEHGLHEFDDYLDHRHEASLKQAMKWSPASGMAGRGRGADDPYGEFVPTHTYNPIGWDQFDSRPHPGSNAIAAGSPVQLHGKMDPSGLLVHIRDEDGNHQTVDKRSLGNLLREASIRVAADDDDDDDDDDDADKVGGPQNVPGAYEPDRGLYAESPEGQAEATRGYEEAYSSGRMIDFTGAGVDVLGTVPVQGYAQDASRPNGEMWPWEQNPVGTPPKGAADVADVPTAGMISAQQTGSSYPQPKVTKNSRLDAFRATIAARIGAAQR
jgi:hypothetical protein